MSSRPCVGCGWCCLDNPCEESQRRHGYLRRCPDLVWLEEPGRYACAIMLDPTTDETLRIVLGQGQGCCAPLNSWRDDVRKRD